MTSHYSAELVRRCEERRLCSSVTAICAALGAAVDSGLIELPTLLDLVRSCSTAGQLGDALTMLAASANGHCEQELAIPAGGATWTR